MLLWGLFSKQRLLILAAYDSPQDNAIVVLNGGRVIPPGAAGVSEWSDPYRLFGGVELFQAV